LGLHNAVSRGDIGSICYALLGGQPIDSVMFGLQPIHVAACQDDPTILDFLLRNGADINAQTTLRTPRHRRSPTYQRQPQPQPQPPQPLPQTPQHGRRPSIQLWPQHQHWYYGATPLHFAVANRHMSIIEHLVRNGALLDVPDSYGNTSEAIALARGDDDVARLL
ncbi:ankyrin, partial [Martensiomyces pterosporus]